MEELWKIYGRFKVVQSIQMREIMCDYICKGLYVKKFGSVSSMCMDNLNGWGLPFVGLMRGGDCDG